MGKKQSIEPETPQLNFSNWFERFAARMTKVTGKPVTFIVALLIILVWAVTGPIFNYSDTWQLVINTGTTIITFLMVFLIQQTQNKDSLALQLKLNELIASHEKASNRLVDVEDMTQQELETLKKYFTKISELAESEDDIHKSHTVEEAKELHESKMQLNDQTKGTSKKA